MLEFSLTDWNTRQSDFKKVISVLVEQYLGGVFGQSFDLERLCGLEEACKAVLVDADLPVVDELYDPCQVLVLDVLEDDDGVLPRAEPAQHRPSQNQSSIHRTMP